MAQQAVTEEASEFFPVPLGVMQPGTAAPVDLYISYGKNRPLVLYKSAGEPLREDVRRRLMDNGVERLYLASGDERTYHHYVEAHIGEIIRDDLLPVEEASRLVYESSSRVMDEVFENPRSGRNIERAHSMVEATVLSILKDPESLWHMTAIAGHDYYTYTHCVNVSMFMAAAARDILGIRDRPRLKAVGLGGLLHDIGKSEIPEEILSKPGKLTGEEFDTIKKHPGLGLRILRGARRLGSDTADIVRHHHERLNGAGYPQGLSGESLSEPARLSTIVDVYDALTTKRPYADAREPAQALKLMVEEMEGHFDVSMLKAFIKYLGPREFRDEIRARWNEAFRGEPELKL